MTPNKGRLGSNTLDWKTWKGPCWRNSIKINMWMGTPGWDRMERKPWRGPPGVNPVEGTSRGHSLVGNPSRKRPVGEPRMKNSSTEPQGGDLQVLTISATTLWGTLWGQLCCVGYYLG